MVQDAWNQRVVKVIIVGLLNQRNQPDVKSFLSKRSERKKHIKTTTYIRKQQ